MYGELINIIYNFYYSVFASGSPSVNFVSFNTALFKSFGQTDFWLYFRNAVGSSDFQYSYGLISYFFTWITFILLFLAMIKLFKWIFNLIFKLFKLN